MEFTSLSFLALVGGALLVYYLLPQKARWVALLAASLVFYAQGGAQALCFLGFTMGSTYLAGLALGALAKRKAVPAPDKKAQEKSLKGKKRLVAGTAIVANFLILYLVKYWNFTAQAVGQATGALLPQTDLLLPLGLSFYMFQSVGYVIDCYREKYPPQRNPLKYALFVSFFPQMVQGPISRFDQLAPQLLEGRPFQAENLKYGIQLAMWGYMKKLIIADRFSVAVDTVFSNYQDYGGAMTALAVLMYCAQLYCDFSGGIDVTRGVAQMFGIDMAENFRRPIFATSLTDFWRRWHITLGAWMRDYVFYSLSLSKPFGRLGRFTRKKIGGKLGKIIPTSLATFVVYLIIGIWHGANFRYIAFGFYNGALITAGLLLANRFYQLRVRLGIQEGSKGLYVFRLVRTMALVFVGRYITRAPRLLVAFSMLWRTVSSPCLYQIQDMEFLNLGLEAGDLWVAALGCAVLLLVEFFQERGVAVRKALERQNPFVQWLFILLPLGALLLFGILRDPAIQAEFIYQQF